MDLLVKEKYQLKNRFQFISIFASRLGMIAHAILAFLCYLIGVYEMVIYNVLSTGFFWLMLYLARKKKNPEKIVLLESIEVVLHAYLGTYFIGYESYVIYFILVLPPVYLFNVKWQPKTSLVYFLIVGGALVLSYYLFKDYVPVYELSEELLKVINIMVLGMVSLIILMMIYYFSEIVHHNDIAMNRVNKMLVAKNNEKGAMLKEIHHRVKNNLHVVNSLLRMQSSTIDDENVVAMFEEAQKRVLSMALLHEKMYNSEDLQHISVRDHFTYLAEDLVSSYAVGKEIKLDINIEEVDLEIGTLVPLGLVINEIISNALKYAFNESDSGIIKIQLKKIAHRTYEMIIGDNGVGLRTDSLNEGQGGKLMHIFIKQINGVIELIETPGTFYKIVFDEI